MAKNKSGRPKLWANAEELEAKIESYKKYLKDDKKPPTIAGLAYYLGVDRGTIYNYKKEDEFFHTIKGFVDWIIMNWEEYALDNSSAGLIFLMKNYGYTDKQDIEHSGELGVKVTWK